MAAERVIRRGVEEEDLQDEARRDGRGALAVEPEERVERRAGTGRDDKATAAAAVLEADLMRFFGRPLGFFLGVGGRLRDDDGKAFLRLVLGVTLVSAAAAKRAAFLAAAFSAFFLSWR